LAALSEGLAGDAGRFLAPLPLGQGGRKFGVEFLSSKTRRVPNMATQQFGRWRFGGAPSPIGARPGAGLESPVTRRARVVDVGEHTEGIERAGRNQEGKNWRAMIYGPAGRQPPDDRSGQK